MLFFERKTARVILLINIRRKNKDKVQQQTKREKSSKG
jgi:hypothetical protein